MNVAIIQNGFGLQANWWLHYLAWLAGQPRNVIECSLEPPGQPRGGVSIVQDQWSLEELGVAEGYPTAGKQYWWMIMVMDGAPERLATTLAQQRQPLSVARYQVTYAENRFSAIVMEARAKLPIKPEWEASGSWFDGVVLGFLQRERAIDLARAVAAECARINAVEGLSWAHQFHVRAGIGTTVRRAFSELLGAQCDQVRSQLVMAEQGPFPGCGETIPLL